MIANTMTSADNPEIKRAMPNLDAVLGSFPFTQVIEQRHKDECQ